MAETRQDHDADEVALRTAIDAAPYLLSADTVEKDVPPRDLFGKLQEFKDLVADDIERSDGDAS